MSNEQKPMVFVESIVLSEEGLTELQRIVRNEMDKPDCPVKKEMGQLRFALGSMSYSGRKVELRVVPDEEDTEA